jgi:hypothetical protein
MPVNGQAIRRQAVFGGADGIVLAIGFVVSFTGQPHALVKAALAAGLAELVGMTAGCWLSDSGSGLWPALANGGGALAACFAPAVPYLLAHGLAALIPSLLIVAGVAGVISWLRPSRGILAAAETYGVLAVAAALCWLVSLA